MAGRGHRLGAEALLRDHLMRRAFDHCTAPPSLSGRSRGYAARSCTVLARRAPSASTQWRRPTQAVGWRTLARSPRRRSSRSQRLGLLSGDRASMSRRPRSDGFVAASRACLALQRIRSQTHGPRAARRSPPRRRVPRLDARWRSVERSFQLAAVTGPHGQPRSTTFGQPSDVAVPERSSCSKIGVQQAWGVAARQHGVTGARRSSSGAGDVLGAQQLASWRRGPSKASTSIRLRSACCGRVRPHAIGACRPAPR